ncbi:MAG: hypothetical protein U1A78_32065 [Polyangia bacterium]
MYFRMLVLMLVVLLPGGCTRVSPRPPAAGARKAGPSAPPPSERPDAGPAREVSDPGPERPEEDRGGVLWAQQN